MLTASDVHAHNTFDQPEVVRTKEAAVQVERDGSSHFTFPTASVTRLTFALR